MGRTWSRGFCFGVLYYRQYERGLVYPPLIYSPMVASTFTKIVATVIAAGMFAPVAFAEGLSAASKKADDGVGVQTSRASTTESRGEEMSGGKAEATETSEDNATTTGQQEREENRSEVAARVQTLLDIADRDGGIGQDVRDIARTYASSSERADEAKASVERRPGWLTFIIGSDYGNLGKIRSEIATTQNDISRLTNARERTTDASVKTALDVQIQALVESASSTEAYVKAHESSFSIFGWFFKLFS